MEEEEEVENGDMVGWGEESEDKKIEKKKR